MKDLCGGRLDIAKDKSHLLTSFFTSFPFEVSHKTTIGMYMADILKGVPENKELFKKLHFFFQKVKETGLALAYLAK